MHAEWAPNARPLLKRTSLKLRRMSSLTSLSPFCSTPVSLACDASGWTALHHCARCNCVDSATSLLTRRDVDINYLSNNGTALDLAIALGHEAFAELVRAA